MLNRVWAVFLVMFLGILFLSSTAAAGNILENPGFEVPYVSWWEWNSVAGKADGAFTTDEAHSGQYSGKRWLDSPDGFVISVFGQELVGMKTNQTINAKAWIKSDKFAKGAESYIAIEFWKGGELLNAVESAHSSVSHLWKEYTVSAVVPDEVDLVKFTTVLRGAQGSEGVIYVDDAEVVVSDSPNDVNASN